MSSPHLDRLLSAVGELEASDLHLVAGVPPAFRVNGEIILANEDALDGAGTGRVGGSAAQRATAQEAGAGMGVVHFHCTTATPGGCG